MKVKYLHIRNYKQFSDLKLDLTYPKGHKKEGKPLDKICIIGQSGTGKTNLLEIIKKSTIDFSSQDSYLPFNEFVGKDTDDRYITTKFLTNDGVLAETLFTLNESNIIFNRNDTINDILDNEKIYYIGANRCSEKEIEEVKKFDPEQMINSDKNLYNKLISKRRELEIKYPNFRLGRSYNILGSTLGLASYPSSYDLVEKEKEKINFILYKELISNISIIEKKYIKIEYKLKKIKKENLLKNSIIDINKNINSTWSIMKEKIDSYEKELLKIKDKLSNKLLNNDNYHKEDFKREFDEWKRKNENILDKIADDLNEILKKFNLELIKIDENQDSFSALTIKDLSNSRVLDYDDLSTGTKNIVSTFIPLKTFSPKDSIILIDEPENSFYPDIQKQLVELYMGVGENNQLIVATHSPLIASSFEPWEVVELKFDDNSQIYREKYYAGENRIENYTIDPRMLTWTGILTDIFDLKEDSNFTYREKKLMEYATLKAEIKSIQNKKEKEKKFEELQKLSKKLGLYNQ